MTGIENGGQKKETASVELKYLLLDDVENEMEGVEKSVREEVDLLCKSKNVHLDPRIVSISVEPKNRFGDALNYIKSMEELPDWVLVDVRLGEKEDGHMLVEKIRELGYPADVLLYTQADWAQQSPMEELRYGKLRVAGGMENIKAEISDMARDFLRKWREPEYLRGIVLSRAADMDVAMDDLIVKYFSVEGEKEAEFRECFFGKQPINLGAKLSIIEAVAGRVNWDQPDGGTGPNQEKLKIGNITDMIRRLLTGTRDPFAHSQLEPGQQQGFGVALRQKGGKKKEFQKDILQKYFLDVSVVITQLALLEKRLGDAQGGRPEGD